LQAAIDCIHDGTEACYLTLNPLKCKYLVCSRKDNILPPMYSAKARKCIGILLYSWADTSTLLLIYTMCIHPHLQYTCQLWDHFASKGGQSLEAMQKHTCKVFLKCGIWTTSPCYNCSTSPHCQFVVTISKLPPCTILLILLF